MSPFHLDIWVLIGGLASGQLLEAGPVLVSWSLSLEHASPGVDGDQQKVLPKPCRLVHELWGTRCLETHSLPKGGSRAGSPLGGKAEAGVCFSAEER